MGGYACALSLNGPESEANAIIGAEALTFTGEGIGSVFVSFADIMDMRLLNYHLHLRLREGEIVVSKLGHQTEEFFEKLWQAYAAMSERSLFVEGSLVMSCEGDYAYREGEVQASSIAKLVLYPDCLCIVPHDAGARRVPLCFAEEPLREGFSLDVRIDTGEEYSIARLGRNTDPFFKHLMGLRESAVASWKAAHAELECNLEARLGDALGAYEALRGHADRVTCGLFSADDEAFWLLAASQGRAAVELVTNEQTATYLYRFDVSVASFELSLRHAMEAMKKNRRVIFLPQDELEAEPLYRMAVDRSAHVRLLRDCNAGRIIHTSNWTTKVSEFFA